MAHFGTMSNSAIEPSLAEKRAAKAARVGVIASGASAYLSARASGVSKREALALHPLRKVEKPGRPVAVETSETSDSENAKPRGAHRGRR